MGRPTKSGLRVDDPQYVPHLHASVERLRSLPNHEDVGVVLGVEPVNAGARPDRQMGAGDTPPKVAFSTRHLHVLARFIHKGSQKERDAYDRDVMP